jgi:malate dehydrogenase (oxaloacetate-decarboxylating)(NADP+)
VPFQPDLKSALAALRPTALIGVAAQAGAFDRGVLESMCAFAERPIVFSLSNPTPLAECTFQQAYEWTSGRALFASGSPFPPITDAAGVTHHPAQANNAYVFPAVGAAALLTRARVLSDGAFVAAAEALAVMTSAEELAAGRLFPPFSAIRAVSRRVIAAVAKHMAAAGEGEAPPGAAADWEAYAGARMWDVDGGGGARGEGRGVPRRSSL